MGTALEVFRPELFRLLGVRNVTETVAKKPLIGLSALKSVVLIHLFSCFVILNNAPLADIRSSVFRRIIPISSVCRSMSLAPSLRLICAIPLVFIIAVEGKAQTTGY